MSKYEPLWKYVGSCTEDRLQLSFSEIEQITGFSIDHAFLTYKKELSAYGWGVGKISMKARTIFFERIL